MFWHLPRNGVIYLIECYQKTLSPDHGPLRHLFPYGYCRYHPTCSMYGKEAFEKKGFIRGILLTLWRVLRCNPFSKGGYDPVEK